MQASATGSGNAKPGAGSRGTSVTGLCRDVSELEARPLDSSCEPEAAGAARVPGAGCLGPETRSHMFPLSAGVIARACAWGWLAAQRPGSPTEILDCCFVCFVLLTQSHAAWRNRALGGAQAARGPERRLQVTVGGQARPWSLQAPQDGEQKVLNRYQKRDFFSSLKQ